MKRVLRKRISVCSSSVSVKHKNLLFWRCSGILESIEFFIHFQIATSIAARGLDVKHLILVVNYDCPNHYEDYVHRCGYVIFLLFSLYHF